MQMEEIKTAVDGLAEAVNTHKRNLDSRVDGLEGRLDKFEAAANRAKFNGSAGRIVSAEAPAPGKGIVYGPGMDKSYGSLFGTSRAHTWEDPNMTFWEAVFSGRAHPGLSTKAMTEGTPSDGGYAVPEEWAERIHAVSLEGEIVMPRANVVPMVSNEKHLPGFQIGDHSSSLYGGFTAAYAAEAATLSQADPKLRDVTLQALKLTGFVRASNELMEDIRDAGGQLAKICGQGLGWYRDRAFLKGTGAGQPLGILNAPCKITQDKESGQTAASIEYSNITKMLSRLWPGSFQRAVWIAHPTTIPQLLALSIAVGTGGSHYPVLQESQGGYSMLTRPILFTEKAEPLGTEGDLILADFSQYVIGLRRGMRVDVSQHLYFDSDETALRLIERHDGQPMWDEALTLEDGSNTVSPFVTLQSR